MQTNANQSNMLSSYGNLFSLGFAASVIVYVRSLQVRLSGQWILVSRSSVPSITLIVYLSVFQ